MSHDFDHLVQIMAKLRAPEGCPWDRKQTHESLKAYLLEETYEVLEAIDEQDMAKLKEELGDLLLQILFQSQIASEAGTFTVRDVIGQLAEKLVRRHPHVFGATGPEGRELNAEQVYTRWEQIKSQERSSGGQESSALDGVPKVLPALLRAYQVQARASRVGFDWPETASGLDRILGKIEEEIAELRAALGTASSEATDPEGARAAGAQSAIELEMGDVFFALVNLARFVKVNPEDALRRAVNRFTDRFHYIESRASRDGRRIEEMTLEDMDRLWEEAKRRESSQPRALKEKGP